MPFNRITGDPQRVEAAKAMVYELIAEKEMLMFHRGSRGGGGGGGGGSERGSFSNDNGFNHGGGPPGDGVEVKIYKIIFFF